MDRGAVGLSPRNFKSVRKGQKFENGRPQVRIITKLSHVTEIKSLSWIILNIDANLPTRDPLAEILSLSARGLYITGVIRRKRRQAKGDRPQDASYEHFSYLCF